jgi:hypothetical protein
MILDVIGGVPQVAAPSRSMTRQSPEPVGGDPSPAGTGRSMSSQ